MLLLFQERAPVAQLGEDDKDHRLNNEPPRDLQEEENEPARPTTALSSSVIIDTALAGRKQSREEHHPSFQFQLPVPVQDDGDDTPAVRRPTAIDVVDNNNNVSGNDNPSSPYFQEATRNSEDQSLGGPEEDLVSEGEKLYPHRSRRSTNGTYNGTSTIDGENQAGDFALSDDFARALHAANMQQEAYDEEVEEGFAMGEMSTRESAFAFVESADIEDICADEHVVWESFEYSCQHPVVDQDCSSLQSLYPNKNECGTMCAICLMDYKVGDILAWSFNEKCDHAYHADCIKDWLLLP